MRKLTLLFLASALGASVFGAEPKFKVGDELTLGGRILIVVGLDDNGDPLFKSKTSIKPEKKEAGFFATLFSSEEEKELNPADKVAEDFLAILRRKLKEQGKEPCGDCYSMMERGYPRIPRGHFNYRAPEEECTSLLGCK